MYFIIDTNPNQKILTIARIFTILGHMARKNIDPTVQSILDEVKRLENQIEMDKVRLATLRAFIPIDQMDSAEKPVGFILTNSIKKVLEAHRGQIMPSDDIYDEVVRNANGYKPNRKSLDITLSVWAKEGKVKKDEKGGGFYLDT